MTITDVTEREQERRALAESRGRLRSVLEAASALQLRDLFRPTVDGARDLARAAPRAAGTWRAAGRG